MNVKTGRQTIYSASKSFGIPESTIRYRLSGKWSKKTRKGPPTVLSQEEEDKLVAWLIDRQRRGIPVVKETLYSKVKTFLDATSRPSLFRNSVPGRKWFNSFLQRHKSITMRTPEAVSAASAKVSESDIRGWFAQVASYLEEQNLQSILQDPSRIYNGDETSFFLHPKTKAVLAARGSRNVYEVEHASSHLNIMVMFSFAVDGSVVPPDVILPMKRIRTDLLRSFPADWGIGKSAKGWMDASNFALYIQQVFHPFLLKKGVTFPVIYFVDGHASHMAADVADLCLDLGIILIVLYPNTTRITQPADGAIFKPLKSAWKAAVSEWHDSHNGEVLSLNHFGPVLQEAMKRGIDTSSIINGFKACGLYPFNADNIDYTKCIAKSAVPTVNPEASFIPQEPTTVSTTTRNAPNIRDNRSTHPLYITDSVIITYTIIEQALKDIGEERLQKITTALELSDEETVIKNIYVKLLQPFHTGLASANTANVESVIPMHISDNTDDFEPFLTAEQIQDMPVDIIPPDGRYYEMGSNLSFEEFDDAAPVPNSDLWNTAFEYTDYLNTNTSTVLNNFTTSSTEITTVQPVTDDSPQRQEQDASTNTFEEFSHLDEPFNHAPCTSKQLDNGAREQVNSVLVNITNQPSVLKRKRSISDFLDCPDTPKRSGKHRNYKRKFYPVLTAGERLEEIRRIEEEKLEVIRQRKENAEKRVARKVEAEKLKAVTLEQKKEKAEKRAQRKIEAEQLKAAMREGRRKELAMRKQERENFRRENRCKAPASKRDKINLFKALNLSNAVQK